MQTPATLMRGGTSKCWIFDSRDVPADRAALTALLVDTFGAEDPRQLDGVGGGTSVTSKAAIVSRSADPSFDIDYLFAQVAVGESVVEWGSNCGNCATAVALWAVDTFDLAHGAPSTEVRMRNLNTGAEVTARVDTEEHEATVSVPGVRGAGTAVDLAFINPVGSTTGSLWPSGNHRDELTVDGLTVAVSMADAGAPVALVEADSLGVSAAATEEQVRQYVPMLRKIRARAAVAMGIAPSIDEAFDAIPKVGIVGPPVDYVTSLGESVSASDYDVSVRMLSMNNPHPTIGLTSAVAIAIATTATDSVLGPVGQPTDAASPTSAIDVRVITIGTLGGTLRCEVEISADGSRVLLRRAARRLADSQLYVR